MESVFLVCMLANQKCGEEEMEELKYPVLGFYFMFSDVSYFGKKS